MFQYFQGALLGQVTEGARLQVNSGTDFILPLPLPRLALDAGQVGLALSYALSLMGMFQWCVRQSAEVENMVTFIVMSSAFFKSPCCSMA